MKNWTFRYTTLLAVLGLVVACDTSVTEPEQDPEPWEIPVVMGNFFVNTGPVTTHQDGVSLNHVSDYVFQNQLPPTALEVFTIHAYVPTRDGVITSIPSVSVVAQRQDGSTTGNIYQSGEFVQFQTLQGQQYSVYRLNGFFIGTPSISPATFANVNFIANVTYQNQSGAIIGTRQVKLEVYKRN